MQVYNKTFVTFTGTTAHVVGIARTPDGNLRVEYRRNGDSETSIRTMTKYEAWQTGLIG